ncbi:MAG: hypothetical protein B6D37_02960 [Sphingobacteriales bacterium UTBCD1]|jgi:hypothetical protein|nr:MAG: hypothetical protein B6D37_02960 [Sphingobacteriales bacterium UTBCD1]
MRKVFALIPILFILFSCKKVKENIAQDAIISAMTSGQWVITQFTNNGSNITSSFSGYKFQYYSNKTVDAIKNGNVEKTGNWDGNASTMTTWASFPGAGAPLDLINGTWHIDNNSWTFVVASQANGSDTKTMRLDKQ